MNCPQCSKPVEQTVGFVTWCDCGWNAEAEPESRFQKRDYVYGLAVHRLKSTATARTIVSTFIPTIVLVIAIALALLVAGIELIMNHFWLSKIIGLLFSFGFMMILRPLFSIPIKRKHLHTINEFPALKEWLTSMGYRVTHLCFTPRFGFRFHSAAYSRRHVLEIGIPLARVLDQSGFETVLVREYQIQSLQQRLGWNYMNWAREVLFSIADICIEQGAERERWRSMQMGGYVRTPTVNQWVKVLLVPIGLVPLMLIRATQKGYLTVYHLCVYRANERTAGLVGQERVSALLKTLSFEDTALFYGRDFNDRFNTIPEREKLRLLRTSTEEKFFRPMIHWQLDRMEGTPSEHYAVPTLPWMSLQQELLSRL